jgi:hypothetical protein
MHCRGSTYDDELRLSSDDDPHCGRAVSEVFQERVTRGSSSLPPVKAEQSPPLNHICVSGSLIDQLTVSYSFSKLKKEDSITVERWASSGSGASLHYAILLLAVLATIENFMGMYNDVGCRVGSLRAIFDMVGYNARIFDIGTIC